MSLLDDNLDIDVKDIVENACKTFVKHHILSYDVTNDITKFVFTWGAIKPNSIMKYSRKYYLGVINVENICFITLFNKYRKLDPYCCYNIIKNTTLYDILNFN